MAGSSILSWRHSYLKPAQVCTWNVRAAVVWCYSHSLEGGLTTATSAYLVPASFLLSNKIQYARCCILPQEGEEEKPWRT